MHRVLNKPSKPYLSNAAEHTNFGLLPDHVY